MIRQTVIDECGRFNFATTTITIDNPEITIDKAVDPDRVAPGDIVTYTITVTNVGDVNAHLTELEDVALPPGFTYVPGSTTGLTTDDPVITSQNLTWTGDWNIPPAGNAVLTYQALASSVPGDYPSGAATDEVCVDTVVSVEDTAPVTVTLDADMRLDMGVDNATPVINDTITFAITVTNDGPNNATGTSVWRLSPAGLTFILATPSQGSYTPASGVWDIGAIADGVIATLDISARF